MGKCDLDFNPLTPEGAVYFNQSISMSHLRIPIIEGLSVLVEDSVPVFQEEPEFKKILPALPFERIGTYIGIRDNPAMWVHVDVYNAIAQYT